MEYKRLSRCGVDGCKQTLFYVEAGQTFCKYGHQRLGELQLTEENEGFGPTGTRATRATVETKKVYKVLRGRKGFELYVQCLQVILQKQVWWLVHEKGFPKELEVIARDLWALRLQILTDTLAKRDSGSQAPSQSSTQNPHSGDVSSASSYIHSSADSGAESQSTQASRHRRRHRSRSRSIASNYGSVPKPTDRPKLIVTLAICYLGLLMLRCPVTIGDFHRWVESQDICYLRAIKKVPENMKEKLSAEYWTALDPRAVVRKGRLTEVVGELVVGMQTAFGISFPPLNREALWVRFVEELGMPLEVYPAAKSLADHLFLSFMWPSTGALATRQQHAHWPESKLMAILIMAMKLCYGMDSVIRHPSSATEPAATQLDLNSYEKFLRSTNVFRRGELYENDENGGCGKVRRGFEIDVTENDVFDMKPEEMDAYMDWYEKTWCGSSEDEKVKEKNTKTLTVGILNLFPTNRTKSDPPPTDPLPPPADFIVTLNSSSVHAPADVIIPPTRPSASDPAFSSSSDEASSEASRPPRNRPFRPGDQYLWDVTTNYSGDSQQPRELALLLQAAADLLGIKKKDLELAVKKMDYILVERAREERRRERYEGKRINKAWHGELKARERRRQGIMVDGS